MNTISKTLPKDVTEQFIYDMLTEGTGRSLLDSGGHYGRHWQKNQDKTLQDFINEPAVSFKLPYNHEGETVSSEDITVTVSIFHYLVGTDRDSTYNFKTNDLTDEYNAMLPAENWDSDIYGVSKEQKEWLEANGFEIKDSFNTYNGEWLGSQTLQGTYAIGPAGDSYVLLQLHNGADVRGGYTDARLLLLGDGYMPPCDASVELEQDMQDTWLSTYYNGYSLTNDNGASVDVPVKDIEQLEMNAMAH